MCLFNSLVAIAKQLAWFTVFFVYWLVTMAEKEAALTKIDYALSCPVCLDDYTDPKRLECDHVYCQKCLRRLVDHSKSVVVCPQCRRVTSVPDNQVAKLPLAYRINELEDIRKSVVRAFEGPSATVTKHTSCCSVHPREEVKLYCKSCEEFICCYCVLKGAEHQHHSYKKLDFFIEQIESSLEPLKQQRASIDESLQQLGATCEEINSQGSDAKKNVEKIVDDIHKAVEKHKSELFEQIQGVTQMKLTSLASQIERLKSRRDQLQHCQNDVENKLVQSDKKSIVEVKDGLIKQIQEFTTESPVLYPCTTADIKFLPMRDPSMLCKCGTLSAKELLPVPSKCFVTDEMVKQRIRHVGDSVSIIVQAIDHFDNPCHLTQELAPPLKFRLTSELNSKTQFDECEISESQYQITFTPKFKGLHNLQVTISSWPIKGSPFDIGVSPFDIGVQSSFVLDLSNQISSIAFVERPWGIAVNSKQNILVTESDGHCVSVFSPSGRHLRSFGTFGSGKGQFNNPRGIAVDHDDNIAVVDYNNHRIQMFEEDGSFLRQIGPDGKGPLQFKAPTAIAFNTYNKYFYVIDKREHSSVQILSPKFISCGSLGTDLKEAFLTGQPDSWCIGCDSIGKVYVAMVFKVYIFEPEGTFLKSIGSRMSPFVLYPGGIAFDVHDRMYISSCNSDEIFIFNYEGNPIKKDGQFNHPKQVAIDCYGILYVCDMYKNCIRMY